MNYEIELLTTDQFQNASVQSSASEAEALDAYSRTVIGVADRVSPSVANIEVHTQLRSRQPSRFPQEAHGSGSGFIFTPDGLKIKPEPLQCASCGKRLGSRE